MVLDERKRMSLGDCVYKYRIKHQLIQGFISDEEWKIFVFLIPTLSPVENEIKDLQYKYKYNWVILKMEECLSKIRFWMSENLLKLNDKKTEFIVIGKSNSLSKLPSDKSIMVGQ